MVGESVSRRPLDGEQIDRRLARIRELFARWAALRPGDREVWRIGLSPLGEAEVAGVEARMGLRLPENYRRYLLEFGDPGNGLMSYGSQPFGQQCEPRSAKPFPLNGPWAGGLGEIAEWERTEEGDFFEDGPGEFYGQFDDPKDAFYDLPGNAEYADGTLTLGATRSHFLARLVLNGPWAGTVWFDSFGYDGGLIHLADDGDDPFQDYTLGSFFDAEEWRPLVGQPWFPALEEGVADPAPGDFLDLTLGWLRYRVRQAEAERACDQLDVATIKNVNQRLRSPHDFGFPRGHTYGSFGPYVSGLMREELLRAAPDRASCERIVELTEAVFGVKSLPAALILAGRWQELIDIELNTFLEHERSAVNLALAAVMLGTEPAPPAMAPTQPSPQHTGNDRWVVLNTLTRINADQQQQFLDHLPIPDATELRPLLQTATLPVTKEALDGLLTEDMSDLNRVAATVMLVRALHTMAADGNPTTELADRVCALAVAVDRVGDVFDLLTAVTGDRWADWRAAREDGQRWLDTHRTPQPAAEPTVPER
ncbi:SMI1/KNR4 family protein [Streptomyces sp. PSKA54]|uniref:SMI1/KNR4 family protein n=1 Tax=Streptomyces himalayensis subsp. aureolus TaxID=2758039 RepID=A0A7W2D9N3_9ACTN|nr:SMI1/KNR4 family protein [Streptomyces himalayensis]MBA4867290.1 SMI1/KNR4 family protein [Streptomyces himalayensis subsp. aureolus]